MTVSQLPDRRSQRAATIVANGDVVEIRPGLFHVTDRAGSGREHVVTQRTCTCEDKARHPDKRCKHQRSVDMQQAQHKCPTCNGATKEELLWAGKHGWLRFRVCTANREHKAIRI